MINRICQWFADRMTPCHIPRDSGEYMRRYFTTPTQEEANWFLHNIMRHDHEDECHNHPYSWQFSIILSGSYDEETLVPTSAGLLTWTRRRRFFNWIPGDKYHRITKLHGDVWTLFFFGPKHGGSWGFWVPGIGHVHNQELARVKAEMDRQYWAKQMEPTCYALGEKELDYLGCSAVGVAGYHSDSFGPEEGGQCDWCGAKPNV